MEKPRKDGKYSNLPKPTKSGLEIFSFRWSSRHPYKILILLMFVFLLILKILSEILPDTTATVSYAFKHSDLLHLKIDKNCTLELIPSSSNFFSMTSTYTKLLVNNTTPNISVSVQSINQTQDSCVIEIHLDPTEVSNLNILCSQGCDVSKKPGTLIKVNMVIIGSNAVMRFYDLNVTGVVLVNKGHFLAERLYCSNCYFFFMLTNVYLILEEQPFTIFPSSSNISVFERQISSEVPTTFGRELPFSEFGRDEVVVPLLNLTTNQNLFIARNFNMTKSSMFGGPFGSRLYVMGTKMIIKNREKFNDMTVMTTNQFAPFLQETIDEQPFLFSDSHCLTLKQRPYVSKGDIIELSPSGPSLDPKGARFVLFKKKSYFCPRSRYMNFNSTIQFYKSMEVDFASKDVSTRFEATLQYFYMTKTLLYCLYKNEGVGFDIYVHISDPISFMRILSIVRPFVFNFENIMYSLSNKFVAFKVEMNDMMIISLTPVERMGEFNICQLFSTVWIIVGTLVFCYGIALAFNWVVLMVERKLKLLDRVKCSLVDQPFVDYKSSLVDRMLFVNPTSFLQYLTWFVLESYRNSLKKFYAIFFEQSNTDANESSQPIKFRKVLKTYLNFCLMNGLHAQQADSLLNKRLLKPYGYVLKELDISEKIIINLFVHYAPGQEIGSAHDSLTCFIISFCLRVPGAKISKAKFLKIYQKFCIDRGIHQVNLDAEELTKHGLTEIEEKTVVLVPSEAQAMLHHKPNLSLIEKYGHKDAVKFLESARDGPRPSILSDLQSSTTMGEIFWGFLLFLLLFSWISSLDFTVLSLITLTDYNIFYETALYYRKALGITGYFTQMPQEIYTSYILTIFAIGYFRNDDSLIGRGFWWRLSFMIFWIYSWIFILLKLVILSIALSMVLEETFLFNYFTLYFDRTVFFIFLFSFAFGMILTITGKRLNKARSEAQRQVAECMLSGLSDVSKVKRAVQNQESFMIDFLQKSKKNFSGKTTSDGFLMDFGAQLGIPVTPRVKRLLKSLSPDITKQKMAKNLLYAAFDHSAKAKHGSSLTSLKRFICDLFTAGMLDPVNDRNEFLREIFSYTPSDFRNAYFKLSVVMFELIFSSNMAEIRSILFKQLLMRNGAELQAGLVLCRMLLPWHAISLQFLFIENDKLLVALIKRLLGWYPEIDRENLQISYLKTLLFRRNTIKDLTHQDVDAFVELINQDLVHYAVDRVLISRLLVFRQITKFKLSPRHEDVELSLVIDPAVLEFIKKIQFDTLPLNFRLTAQPSVEGNRYWDFLLENLEMKEFEIRGLINFQKRINSPYIYDFLKLLCSRNDVAVSFNMFWFLYNLLNFNENTDINSLVSTVSPVFLKVICILNLRSTKTLEEDREAAAEFFKLESRAVDSLWAALRSRQTEEFYQWLSKYPTIEPEKFRMLELIWLSRNSLRDFSSFKEKAAAVFAKQLENRKVFLFFEEIIPLFFPTSSVDSSGLEVRELNKLPYLLKESKRLLQIFVGKGLSHSISSQVEFMQEFAEVGLPNSLVLQKTIVMALKEVKSFIRREETLEETHKHFGRTFAVEREGNERIVHHRLCVMIMRHLFRAKMFVRSNLAINMVIQTIFEIAPVSHSKSSKFSQLVEAIAFSIISLNPDRLLSFLAKHYPQNKLLSVLVSGSFQDCQAHLPTFRKKVLGLVSPKFRPAVSFFLFVDGKIPSPMKTNIPDVVVDLIKLCRGDIEGLERLVDHIILKHRAELTPQKRETLKTTMELVARNELGLPLLDRNKPLAKLSRLIRLKKNFEELHETGEIRVTANLELLLNRENESFFKRLKVDIGELKLLLRFVDNIYSLKDVQSIIGLLSIPIENRVAINNIMMLFRKKRIFLNEEESYVELRRYSDLFGAGDLKKIYWATVFLIQKDYDLLKQLIRHESVDINIRFFINYFCELFFYINSEPRGRRTAYSFDQSINCKEHFLRNIIKDNLLNANILILPQLWRIFSTTKTHQLITGTQGAQRGQSGQGAQGGPGGLGIDGTQDPKDRPIGLDNEAFLQSYSCFVLMKYNLFIFRVTSTGAISWDPNTEFIITLLLYSMRSDTADKDGIEDHQNPSPEESDRIYQMIKIKNKFQQQLLNRRFRFEIDPKFSEYSNSFNENFGAGSFFFHLNKHLLKAWISRPNAEIPTRLLENIDQILKLKQDQNFCCFQHPLINIRLECLSSVFLTQENYDDFVNSILPSLIAGFSNCLAQVEKLLPQIETKWNLNFYRKQNNEHQLVNELIDFSLIGLMEAHCYQTTKQEEEVSESEFEKRFPFLFKLSFAREFLCCHIVALRTKRKFCWRFGELIFLQKCLKYDPVLKNFPETSGKDPMTFMNTLFITQNGPPQEPHPETRDPSSSGSLYSIVRGEILRNSLSKSFLRDQIRALEEFPKILGDIRELLKMKNSYDQEFIEDKISKIGLPFEEFKILTALLNFQTLSIPTISWLKKRFESVFKSNLDNLIGVLQLLTRNTIDKKLRESFSKDERDQNLYDLLLKNLSTDQFEDLYCKVFKEYMPAEAADDLLAVVCLSSKRHFNILKHLDKVKMLASGSFGVSKDSKECFSLVDYIFDSLLCDAEFDPFEMFKFIGKNSLGFADTLTNLRGLLTDIFSLNFTQLFTLDARTEKLLAECFDVQYVDNFKLLGVIHEVRNKELNEDLLDDYLYAFISFSDYDLLNVNVNNARLLLILCNSLHTKDIKKVLSFFKKYNLKTEYSYILSFYAFFSLYNTLNDRRIHGLANDYLFILFMLSDFRLNQKKTELNRHIENFFESMFSMLEDLIFNHELNTSSLAPNETFLNILPEALNYSMVKIPDFVAKTYDIWNENYKALFRKAEFSPIGGFLRLVNFFERIELDQNAIYSPGELEKAQELFGKREGINFYVFELLLNIKQFIRQNNSLSAYPHSKLKILDSSKALIEDRSQESFQSLEKFISSVCHAFLQSDLTVKMKLMIDFYEKNAKEKVPQDIVAGIRNIDIQCISDFMQILQRCLKTKKLDEALPFLKKNFKNLDIPVSEVYSFVKMVLLIHYNVKSYFVLQLNFKSEEEAMSFLVRGNQLQSRQMLELEHSISDTQKQEEWANVGKYATNFRNEILTKKRAFGILVLNIFDSFTSDVNCESQLVPKVFNFIYRDQPLALQLTPLIIRTLNSDLKQTSKRKGQTILTKSQILDVNSILVKYLTENNEIIIHLKSGLQPTGHILKVLAIFVIIEALLIIKFVLYSEDAIRTLSSIAVINALLLVLIEIRPRIF